eukprot:CAMPEP_0206608734 /NCGR_PEP_ID=MMETSP0325_2-20121206/53254_1 /ASSEMBLY_ACC=CAM_ASM_000347 /TAXON_ID=2866 /ORGANISM="Crypthecodinium cohnii, Strain Seligo" /LENGTH=126 /DNA_ID=CAMNT_0054126659 /DNA_START=367 /DNA_END=748 /DNA_ORIENTATION=+
MAPPTSLYFDLAQHVRPDACQEVAQLKGQRDAVRVLQHREVVARETDHCRFLLRARLLRRGLHFGVVLEYFNRVARDDSVRDGRRVIKGGEPSLLPLVDATEAAKQALAVAPEAVDSSSAYQFEVA